VDESYTIHVDGSSATPILQAPTVWGALRALETFVQATEYHEGCDGFSCVPELDVADAPRFAWRGLMIDCSRHWMSPSFVLHIIESMVASKLNVLHMHWWVGRT